MPKDKPAPRKNRDEDRVLAAVRALDNAEVFLLITAERDGDGLPEMKLYASDDFSHERLFNLAMMELPAAFPFKNEVIEVDDSDNDEDDDE